MGWGWGVGSPQAGHLAEAVTLAVWVLEPRIGPWGALLGLSQLLRGRCSRWRWHLSHGCSAAYLHLSVRPHLGAPAGWARAAPWQLLSEAAWVASPGTVGLEGGH